MSHVILPEAFFERGYVDQVSVIPPNAQLAPTSKIAGAQLGKVPGHRLKSGLWVGTSGWQNSITSLEDVRRWTLEGANVGLRADSFPAIDIDCTEPGLSKIIEGAALQKLGPAPIRIGRYPKRLLMYRTDTPFSRMRLTVKVKDTSHLVEALGTGQQYLIHGTHPATLKAYTWSSDVPRIGELTLITREQVDLFFTYLEELFDVLGIGAVTRSGDGRARERGDVAEQKHLLAPSLEALREAVALLPNTNETHPDRDDYLKIGYAIRAAAGEEFETDAYQMFAEWASKWEGNSRSRGNDPDVVLADWRRFHAPYAVGWSFLAEQARAYGYNDAAHDFEAVEGPVPDDGPAPVTFSDQWLAEKVVERRKSDLRFVPMRDEFIVWDGFRWQPDAVMLAESIIVEELRRIGDSVVRMGATLKEQKEHERIAINICSANKATAVRTLLQSDRSIATAPSALDHDPWLLNTPRGVVDLKTGVLAAPDPNHLCTKATSVPPDFNGACPEWLRFLHEATNGDAEVQAYLQRLAGYCLTGVTDEQHLTFMWGPGGNGKSVLINVLSGVLGEYARTATMDTFTSSSMERHSTDIAMLFGARLVTASETQAGKRWDDQRVKELSGGTAVSARFMRQDNFTFMPTFKMVFTGNFKPEIRNIDDAFRRRLHLVPFTTTPAKVDMQLGAKLREEWPAIFAWMIQGCLDWQKQGLNPPTQITASTEEYFKDEDAVGRWLEECCEHKPGAEVTTAELFGSWREWANESGEYVGSMRRFASALVARKYERWRHPVNRRMGFKGLVVRPQMQELVA